MFPALIERFRFEDENEYETVRDLTKSFFAFFFLKTARKLHFNFNFSPKTLVRLFILKEVKPSLDRKMIKLLIFDNLFPPP